MENEDLVNKGILIDEVKNSRNLLVSFGGIKQGMGIPVFEFYKSFQTIECNKIFIRDFKQMWYQKGVDEEISSIAKLIDHLDRLLTKKNYSKVCFIGNSMGGFGAILCGAILNIDKVIVFSPQTFIDRKNRILKMDRRWQKQISNVYKNSNSTSLFDLKQVIKKKKIQTKFDIHYSTDDRLDRVHAERLSKISQVNLFSYNKGGHNLVKELKASKQLESILSNIFL